MCDTVESTDSINNISNIELIDLLTRTKDILELRGWCQHVLENGAGCFCFVGAMSYVWNNGAVGYQIVASYTKSEKIYVSLTNLVKTYSELNDFWRPKDSHTIIGLNDRNCQSKEDLFKFIDWAILQLQLQSNPVTV